MSETNLIVLSSSDDEEENKNTYNKVRDKSSTCTVELTKVRKRKHSTNETTSEPEVTVTHMGGSKNALVRNPDLLIEQFVSAASPTITVEKEKRIVFKVYDLAKKCSEQYLHSREFERRIVSAIDNVRNNPQHVFLHIKELYDNMRNSRTKKSQENGNDSRTTKSSVESEDEHERHIQKLEKLLEKLDRKIRKLKRRECSLDELDDSNSAYIYEDKLTKRFMKVWEKICELKKRSPRIKNNVDKKFCFNGSRYPELNREVESFVNTQKIFPDYTDILKITRRANESFSLGLSEPAVQNLAGETFQDVGRELKERRQRDYVELFGSYLTDDLDVQNDPADTSPTLKETLDTSYNQGQEKFKNLLIEFTEKQINLKLEPVEVPDDELAANEDGAANSDDEEEDLAIENEQIEDEIYSDDEKLNKYLKEENPSEGEARSPSLTSSSDNDLEEIPLDAPSVSVTEIQNDIVSDPKPELVDSPLPVLNVGTTSADSLNKSPQVRSCMARLKVTPLLKSHQSDPNDSSEGDRTPPLKRACVESQTVKPQSISKAIPEPEIICID